MRTMTIDELIEQLEEARDDLGGETEVLVANQPTYPLTNVISNIAYGRDIYDDEEGDEEEKAEKPDRRRDALWIAVSQPGSYSDLNPYAPEGAWR